MSKNIKDYSEFRSALKARMSNMDDGSHRQDQFVRALEKIDTGAYGKCESCGREIDEERLEIIPEAERCVACQRSRELHAQSQLDQTSADDLREQFT